MVCSRRSFMASLAATGTAAAFGMPAPKAKHPNVLFIYTDDQTFDSIHALGNSEIKTPNLDRLVRRGTAMLNCYNPGGWHGAICTASRHMLNTGRFLWQASKLEHKPNAIDKTPLWGRLWQKAGYETYMTGKWHVSIDPKACFNTVRNIRPGMPQSCEAAYNRPHEGQTDLWQPWDKKRGGHWAGPNGKHWTAITADDTIDYITRCPKDKPFFIYAAFNAPHDPRQSPKKYIDMYPLDKIRVPKNYLPEYPDMPGMGVPKNLRDERLAPYPRSEFAIKTHRAEYYALITYLDAHLGRIFDALEKSGRADNTLIALVGDNGLSVGQHGFLGKQNAFEHAFKVPLIFAGPGVPKNQVRDGLVYVQDLRPTLLKLAGIPESPEATAFRSFDRLFAPGSNRNTPAREHIYGAYMRRQRFIRVGNMKLIWYGSSGKKPGRWLLFDLSKDPLEMNNLSEDPRYKQTVDNLRTQLLANMKRVGDPVKHLN